MPHFPKQKLSSPLYRRFSQALSERESEHLIRSLEITPKKILFSSNDYLGLSSHPKVIEGAKIALETYGFGSGSARSFSTHLPLHLELEERVAKTLKREKALLFSSGFQLNSTLLKTLGNDNTLFFLDKLCHRSLLEGAYAARGKTFRFRHNDKNHLEELLKKYRQEGQEAWIVTESLFSMQGDRAPLNELIGLKERFGAHLLVDEAHSFGALGRDGNGISPEGVDLIVGAFGKALGGFGGFVAGEKEIIDYLLNFSPGFLFTTALPPSVIGGLIEGLKLLPSLNEERKKLVQNSERLRKTLALPRGDQIIPFPVETPERALFLSKGLRELGFEVPAVRPPTVPPNGSLLRFSITACHTEAEIDQVAAALSQLDKFSQRKKI